MRFLVTGATGFVGRHLVRALSARGDEVIALRRASSDVGPVAGLPRVRWVQVDLGDRAAVDAGPDSSLATLEAVMDGVDVVFHVAGHLSWWRGRRERQRMVNVEGTRRVAAAALRAGVARLVYTSSVAAIGFPEDSLPVDESFPFNGYELGIQYGISKHEGELRVLEAVRDGLDAVIVNPATILGDDAPRRGSLVELAARGALPVWIDGGTTFCAIDDVVTGHLAAAERGKTGERYILGGPHVTFREILARLAEAAGVVPPARRVPGGLVWAGVWAMEALAALTGREPPLTRDHARLAGRHLYYSSVKAQRELGYAVTPLEATVEQAVRRYLDSRLARSRPSPAGPRLP